MLKGFNDRLSGCGNGKSDIKDADAVKNVIVGNILVK